MADNNLQIRLHLDETLVLGDLRRYMDLVSDLPDETRVLDEEYGTGASLLIAYLGEGE